MRKTRHLGAAAGLVAASLAGIASAAPRPEDTHLYGPPPSWDAFRTMAEQAIAAKLIDPDSAKLSWAGGFYKGAFKVFLTGSAAGYVGCGEVNARNRFGGYAGAVGFAVVIDYGRVLFAAVDHDGLQLVAAQCVIAQRSGLVPPLPAATSATASAPAASNPSTETTATGLTLRAMPEGAYVSGVDSASAAARAGLKPGMVVTAVNGIPLAGMGEAMLKVMSAAGGDATLTLVGGGQMKLGAAK